MPIRISFFVQVGITIVLGALLLGAIPLTVSAGTPGIVQQYAACEGNACGTCEVVQLANGIIKWIIGFVFLLFAVLLVRAGVKLVLSGGNPGALQDAKESFINALIGFLIILASWLIIDTLMLALVGKAGDENSKGLLFLNGDQGKTGRFLWSEITCTTQSIANECGKGCQVDVVLKQLEFEQESLTSGCMGTNLSVEQLQALGCRFDPCTTTACLTSCMNVVQGGAIGQPAGNYCATGVSGGGSSATPVSEAGMVSLKSMGANVANWYGITGPDRTDKVHPQAAQAALAMQNAGQARFGKTPFQVTAAYTRGVGHSANSKHYQGIAIDFDPINGVSLAEVAKLAREAGFTYVLIESTHVHADMR